MLFTEILERNGVVTAGADVSFLTVPRAPYFLEPDFLRKTGKIAELPADLLEDMQVLAADLRKDPLLRTLAWHLYRLFCLLPDFRTFPDHIDLTGERTGVLYVIIMLSVYPHLRLRMELDGLPLELADRAMPRCTPLLGNRNVLYPGEKGLQGRALPFMLNYKNGPCFRIGRFDFVLSGVPGHYPELFRSRKDGRYTALCRNSWHPDAEGFLLPNDDTTVPGTVFTVDEKSASGRVIDLGTGRVMKETAVLDLREYERLLPPEARVLVMHIPGGGGMTLEKCRESFLEARDFVKTCFPERTFAAFGCTSWVFNPDWREYLPSSNITKLQKATLAFPFPAAPKSGLYFIFGRDDGDPATYPEDNSMRRAMVRAWREKGTLRSAGMLLPFDEIDKFPLG